MTNTFIFNKGVLRIGHMKFTKRQTEIILSATELIGESGVQKLTTKRLAKKIGFSEPALYRHFQDKNDILGSILLYFKAAMGDGLKKIINDDSTGMNKILEIIDFQFGFFEKFPAVIMVIFSETSFQNEEKLSVTVKNILMGKRSMVGEIVKIGQIDGSIRNDLKYDQLVNVIMGSMRVTVLNWRLSNFGFDLIEESIDLKNTLQIILNK